MQVVEVSMQYDGAGTLATACQLSATKNATTCTLNIEIPATMKSPVFVYYELDNFYQNHRRYVKSRSDLQLAGTIISESDKLSDCDPLRSTAGGKVLQPCGLIANRYFNGMLIYIYIVHYTYMVYIAENIVRLP